MMGIERDTSAAWGAQMARWTGQQLALLLGLSLLVLGGRNAQAAEYCVGSPSELQAALNQAANPSQELFTTTVMLKQGTYHVGNTSLAQGTNTYALELLGGYNSDCSARTLNPDNTVFDGDGNQVRFEPLAELLIEGIRFQNAGSTPPNFGLQIAAYADDVFVQVRNSALVGVRLHAWYGLSNSGMTMKFVNNRVHGFVTPNGANFAAVDMLGMALVRVVGNTIADNAGAHGLHICTSGDVRMASNIGWNNAGDDFRVTADCSDSSSDPGDAEFKNNLYQSISMNTVGGSGSNISNVNPLFVNAGAGNYRLQNASPAINTGVVTVSTADVDLAGNPRVVGSTVDIGAYESSFDDTIPATLTVTTASDSGAGSLRQAILDANVNTDFNFINFNIPGACPRIIVPTSADLPAIVNGVRIDGWTQPGSVTNTRTKGDNATRCIVLHGGGRTTGLQFSGNSSEQFWLQGVAFAGFSPGGGVGEALRMVGGSGNIIRGNQFGGSLSTGAGSLVLSASDTNIVLTGFSQSTVGGESPAHRNVISGANSNGVLITSNTFFSSVDNDILGNLIGSYGLEGTAAANGTGIRIKTSGNTVRDNTIIYNDQDGILLDVAAASGNVIQANRIGVRDFICSGLFCFGGAAGNGRHGVYFLLGPHDNIVYNNKIWSNANTGIFIASGSGATSQKNWLTANSLYDNGGAGTAFIAYNGADNDAAASQLDMANRGLNYPVITRAYGSAQQGTLEGTLTTTNGSYSIDVYSSAQPDAGYPRGEAEVYHRTFYSVVVSNAVSGQNGSASFSIPFPSSPSASLATRVITITATDAAGNTSELSAAVPYEIVAETALFANGFEN